MRQRISIFSFVIIFIIFMSSTITNPAYANTTNSVSAKSRPLITQILEVKKDTKLDILRRDTFTVTPPPPSSPPVVKQPALPTVIPNPGSAQAIAASQVAAKGWGSEQFTCLVALWSKESGWRVNARNPNGAYGIPQAFPGTKMVTAGADWATNPATQIRWGLSYISGRYGTPCAAWNNSVTQGSY